MTKNNNAQLNVDYLIIINHPIVFVVTFLPYPVQLKYNKFKKLPRMFLPNMKRKFRFSFYQR